MSDIAIKVENLSKQYRIGMQEEMHDTMMGAFSSWVKFPLSNLRKLTKLTSFKKDEESEDIIWALKDVSFEVKQGEVLGIIGGNGAGKTTLLKILSRITAPTSGRAIVNGRVGSLLEVGTGFHPELTGRENIFVNGAILGMTKREIERKFDEIVAFSEIEKFIDTPVKRYSSGMRIRLAFSVAAHLEPDILMIDEVLAVGDVAFQKKCLGKMKDVASVGRTVLFISHQMEAISRLCTRCILLNNSTICFNGEVEESITKYLQLQKSSNNVQEEIFKNEMVPGIRIEDVTIYSEKTNSLKTFKQHEPLFIECKITSLLKNLEKLDISFIVRNELDKKVTTYSPSFFQNDLFRKDQSEHFTLKASIITNSLIPGNYNLDLWVSFRGSNKLIENIQTFHVFQENNNIMQRSSRHGFFIDKQSWKIL